MSQVQQSISRSLNAPELAQLQPVRIAADYPFTKLKEWYDAASIDVLGLPGVVVTDIDEKRNKLLIGVRDLGANGAAVRGMLAKRGIPSKAVIVESSGSAVPGNLQQKHRPVVGGLQISESNWICTFGFVARRNDSVRGFVTNSHCTQHQGGVEGTVFGQPNNNNAIGVELVDPPYNESPCPTDRRCRYSDSAFVGLYSGARSHRGWIAHAPDHSVAWNGTSVFHITGSSSAPLGKAVGKVGRTTGRTVGHVTNTCANFNVKDTNITLICQNVAGALFKTPSDREEE